MKWFEHNSTDRDQQHVKIIRSKFGAEGYGIFMSLIEVIAENVKDDNYDDWGCVSDIHDIDSLAVECSSNPVRIKEFLMFCDERNIFQKKNGKLFYPLLMDRLDTFTKRLKRKKPRGRKLRTKFEPSSTKNEVSSTSHTQSHTQSQIQIKEITKEKKFTSFMDLTDEVVKETAMELHISFSDAFSTRNKMRNWLEANGKRYKNYKAALRTWINRGIEDGKIVAKSSGHVPKLADRLKAQSEQEGVYETG